MLLALGLAALLGVLGMCVVGAIGVSSFFMIGAPVHNPAAHEGPAAQAIPAEKVDPGEKPPKKEPPPEQFDLNENPYKAAKVGDYASYKVTSNYGHVPVRKIDLTKPLDRLAGDGYIGEGVAMTGDQEADQTQQFESSRL